MIERNKSVESYKQDPIYLPPRWMIITGFISVMVGCLAVLLPQIAALTAETLVGIALILYGIVTVLNVRRLRRERNLTLGIIGSLLCLVTGLALLLFPWMGMLTLTILVMAFFVVSGIEKISFALSMDKTGYRTWMGLTGLVDIVLAVMVFSFLPSAAAWVLGILVGLSMVFHGAWLLSVGFLEVRVGREAKASRAASLRHADENQSALHNT